MSETFTLEGVQFLRPNGRQRPYTCTLPKRLEPKAREAEQAGARFTAEVLMSGRVSLCIEEPELGDYDCRLIPNGPEVLTAWEGMLDAFDVARFRVWCDMERTLNTPSPTGGRA